MDTVALLGRLFVSLAAVLGVMWLVARRMRKSGVGKSTGLIEILGRQQLSRTSSLAVVRVGNQALVVGVTDSQISVLGDADLEVVREAIGASEGDEPARRRARRAPVHTVGAAALGTPSAPRPTEAGRESGGARSPVAGSALSAQTWKQTVESLRELTSRS